MAITDWLFGKKQDESKKDVKKVSVVNGYTVDDPASTRYGFNPNYNILFLLHRQNSVFRRVVELLSNKIGEAGYTIEDEFGNDISENLCSGYLVTSNDLENNKYFPVSPVIGKMQVKKYIDLILNSNDGWANNKKVLLRDRLISGNSYFHIYKNLSNDIPLGLQRVDPRNISIIANHYGDVYFYIQSTSKSNGSIKFNNNEIFHSKHESDPDYEVYGYSPTESILRELSAAREMEIFILSTFQNRAVPSALFLLNKELDPTSEDGIQVIEDLRKQIRGSDNAGKTIINNVVEDVKILSSNISDLAFIDIKKQIDEKIAMVYGVPMFLLGVSENVNYSNSNSLRRGFINDTLEPLELDLEGELNNELLPRIGLKNVYIRFKKRNDDFDTAVKKFRHGGTVRQLYNDIGQTITTEMEEYDSTDPYLDIPIMESSLKRVDELGNNDVSMNNTGVTDNEPS